MIQMNRPSLVRNRAMQVALSAAITLMGVVTLSPPGRSEKAGDRGQVVKVYGIQNAGANEQVGVLLDLPPGNYRVQYLSGGYLDCVGSCWRADVSCTFSGGTTVMPLGDGQPLIGSGFATLAECEAATRGAAVYASHGGGPAYFWLRDVASGNNNNHPTSIRVSRVL